MVGPECVWEAATTTYDTSSRVSSRNHLSEAGPNGRPRSTVTSARRVVPASNTNTRAQSGSRVPVDGPLRLLYPHIEMPGGGVISTFAIPALKLVHQARATSKKRNKNAQHTLGTAALLSLTTRAG